MSSIIESLFHSPLPVPLVKCVELRVGPTDPRMIKVDITLSLQTSTEKTNKPFGLFVALVNNSKVLAALKTKTEILRHEIANKVSPSTSKYLIKKYIGVDAFTSTSTTHQIINDNTGATVFAKEVLVGLDLIPQKDQNLWVYCVPYQNENEKNSVKTAEFTDTKSFKLGTPIIEPILIAGAPPTTTNVYTLLAPTTADDKDSPAWPGPVYKYRRRYYAGTGEQGHRITDLALKRTSVSNQKVKDLRLLHYLEALNIDNFEDQRSNLSRKRLKNHERVRKELGTKYFSRMNYTRDTTGKMVLLVNFDYGAFINDNLKFSGLFTNKKTLKTCFEIKNITVTRVRKERATEASKFALGPVDDNETMYRAIPYTVGSIVDGAVTTADILDSNFLNIIVNDEHMKTEEISNYVYNIEFEFIDNTMLVLGKMIRRLQGKQLSFETFASKFEAFGKSKYDVEKYLRANTDAIKSDDSWLQLINELLASIWFLFGYKGFGAQSPTEWKKNLTSMVNPMTATVSSYLEFTETIRNYVGGLERITSRSVLGSNDKKFSIKSAMTNEQNLLRQIKFKHTLRPVKKDTEAEVGFDYLGADKYISQPATGLTNISYDDYEARIGYELRKYKVANPSAPNINKYGYLSPWQIRIPYERQNTFGDSLELIDGLVILDNKQNPSIFQFMSNGTSHGNDIKSANIESVLGTVGVSLSSYGGDLGELVTRRLEGADEQLVSSEQYLEQGTFTLDGQYIENQTSGSNELDAITSLRARQKSKVLEGSLSKYLIDGVASDFMKPKMKSTEQIRGSLALSRIQQNPEEFLELNSFERDIFYNSLGKVLVLTGFEQDDIKRPNWEMLTQAVFTESRRTGRALLCRLNSCPPVTNSDNKYWLSEYNSLFLIGEPPDTQADQLRSSHRERYNYYYQRLVKMGKRETAGTNHPFVNVAPEYYVASSMEF